VSVGGGSGDAGVWGRRHSKIGFRRGCRVGVHKGGMGRERKSTQRRKKQNNHKTETKQGTVKLRRRPVKNPNSAKEKTQDENEDKEDLLGPKRGGQGVDIWSQNWGKSDQENKGEETNLNALTRESRRGNKDNGQSPNDEMATNQWRSFSKTCPKF